MKFPSLLLLPLLAATFPVLQGGKVLVFPVDGSHWINMKYIIEALHTNGHNITVIRLGKSLYIKETSPLYNTITLQGSDGLDDDFIKVFVMKLIQILREGSTWGRIKLEMEMMKKNVEMLQQIANMMANLMEDKELIQSLQDAKYDVFLTDPALGTGTILGHYLKLPIIFNVRWTLRGEAHFATAPSPLSYIPVPMMEFTDKMDFLQRVRNLVFYYVTQVQQSYLEGSMFSSLCERYLGPDVDFFSLTQAADIWLMRVDFVFEYPRPIMPNFIHIAGFQCKLAKALPQDLEDFVQSSGDHGFILMSLGTLILQLPHDLANDIAAAFAELPQKVIWRYLGERPSTLGNNTLLVDWMPQNDLLGHPKIKAFVAHGGTNGVQEAIYHGVPIVGIALIFDQPDNLSKMTSKGAAAVVDVATLDKNNFLQALRKVVYEPSYRNNMQRLSRLHRDTPLPPLDHAVFWVEFLMRHKGAPHLRSESYKMPWYVYNSVDVILVLLTALSLLVLATFGIIRYICCRACAKRTRAKQD